jgi:hypothetical protein
MMVLTTLIIVPARMRDAERPSLLPRWRDWASISVGWVERSETHPGVFVTRSFRDTESPVNAALHQPVAAEIEYLPSLWSVGARSPASIDLSFAHLVFSNAGLNELAGGSGQPYVDQGVLNAVEFSLPSLVEQREIGRKVNAAFASAALVLHEKMTAETLVYAREQAKAFHGELVAQDRNDEPAAKLLERIRTMGRATQNAKHQRAATWL